jgi:hypothetical protein
MANDFWLLGDCGCWFKTQSFWFGGVYYTGCLQMRPVKERVAKQVENKL